MTKLEGGSTGNFPKRVFWIFYDPEATDLSEADFVRAEEERLGVTADDQLIVWLSVSPIHVDGRWPASGNVLPC